MVSTWALADAILAVVVRRDHPPHSLASAESCPDASGAREGARERNAVIQQNSESAAWRNHLPSTPYPVEASAERAALALLVIFPLMSALLGG
jgi:hypothetical protein